MSSGRNSGGGKRKSETYSDTGEAFDVSDTDDKWPSESSGSDLFSSDSDDSVGSQEEVKADEKEEEEDDEDQDDAVVTAIRKAKEKKVLNRPPDLDLKAMGMDLCFHPDKDLIAVSTYFGDLAL
jgi:hypothetical protein